MSKRLLLVQQSSELDGSAHSGLLLADGLREAGWETHVAFGFDGPIIERYTEAGHSTYVVSHKNWLRRGRSHQFVKDTYLEWRKARAFEALIDDLAPEVVYVNTAVSLSGTVAAWRRGIPCVWHMREMFAEVGGELHAPSWAVPLARSMIQFLATQHVANSAAAANNMLRGLGNGKAVVVPNAIRAAFFEDRRSKKAARRVLDLPSPDVTVIGVPGTLRPVKGHPFFFRSIAPVLQEREKVMAAVTGGGEAGYVEHLKAQVRALSIGNQVQFMGWVEDMPAFYRACDVVCIPSRCESFGRTVVEAFAGKTAVVATSTGGMSELVEDGVTGRLVAYDDENALREALEALISAPDLRRDMSAHAHRIAEEKYREQSYKAAINKVVDAALSATGQEG